MVDLIIKNNLVIQNHEFLFFLHFDSSSHERRRGVSLDQALPLVKATFPGLPVVPTPVGPTGEYDDGSNGRGSEGSTPKKALLLYSAATKKVEGVDVKY